MTVQQQIPQCAATKGRQESHGRNAYKVKALPARCQYPEHCTADDRHDFIQWNHGVTVSVSGTVFVAGASVPVSYSPLTLQTNRELTTVVSAISFTHNQIIDLYV